MTMSQLILFNKPFRVLSQFTDRDSGAEPRETLADYLDAPGYRPAGRLDYDSEGYSSSRGWQVTAANRPPQHRQWKTYWVQVEGQIDATACNALTEGIMLKDGPTRRAKVRPLTHPQSGHAIRLFAPAKRSRILGLNYQSARAGTDRCGE